MYFGSKNWFFAWRFSNIGILLWRPITTVITLLMTWPSCEFGKGLCQMKAVVINSMDSSLWARWLTSVQPVLALNSNTCTDSCLISWSVLSIFKILLTGLQTQRTVLSPSLMLCDTPYDFLFVTAYVFFIYLFIAHGQSVKLSLLFPGCVSSLLSFCFHGNLFILPEFHCLFCVTCAHMNVICLWYVLWDR